MQLTEQRIGNVLLLKTSGRIDHSSANDFKSSLQPYLEQCRPDGHVILLDFSQTEYISSLGFQILLVAQNRVRSQAGSLAITGLQPGVKSIFDTANLSRVVRNFPSVGEALAQLSPSASASHAPGA